MNSFYLNYIFTNYSSYFKTHQINQSYQINLTSFFFPTKKC